MNASDTTSTPSPAENHPNTTESTTNSSPEKDEAPPGDNASSWSSWSPWEDCSVSCGGCGTTQRYRTCHGDIECRYVALKHSGKSATIRESNHGSVYVRSIKRSTMYQKAPFC